MTASSGPIEMHLRPFLLVLALFAGLASPGFASVFSDAADRLDGEWRGADFVLRVDAKRAQASVDLERPFAWQRFLVKEVTSDEIVFTVGPELFQARVEEDLLTISGTSFRGTRVLVRQDAVLRGTTEN